MATTGVVTNNRSMNGIISFDDGNGGVLENGQLTAQHADTDTSDVTNLTVENNLKLQGTLTTNTNVITNTWLSYLYGLTSNIQQQLDAIVVNVLGSNNIWTGTNTFNNTVTINSNLGVSGSITGPTITNINTSIATKQNTITSTNRLSADLIGTGIVSTAEYNYLDGVTSAIQTQINSKQDTVSSTNRLSADLIGTGIVSTTEYNYLDGVTSAIQTQIDSKLNSTGGTLINGVARYLYLYNMGGTTPSYPSNTFGTICSNFSAGQGEVDIISSGYSYPGGNCCTWWTNNGTSNISLMNLTKAGVLSVPGSITSPTITTINSNIALKQDIISSTNRLSADLVGTGIVSNTEYNYLDGVTSAIQTQIDSKAPTANPTFTGTLKCSAIQSSGTTLSIDASNYITMQGGTVYVSSTGDVLSKSYTDNTGTNTIDSTGIKCNNVDASGHVYATDGGFGTLSATGATTLGYPIYWGSQTEKLTGPTSKTYTTYIPNVILCQGSGTINITMPKNSHTQLIILDNVNVSVAKQTSDLNFSSFVNVANVSTSSSPKTFSSTAMVNLYYVTNGLNTYIYWAKPTLNTTP
jgi:hypothetical protein